MSLDPCVTWSCGVFCNLDDTPTTTHFWVQFINFELDEDWLLQIDQRSYSTALFYGWKRDLLFTGRSLTIDMFCPCNRMGGTPIVLLVTLLRAMGLQLKDASQFVVDDVEEEIEDDGYDD